MKATNLKRVLLALFVVVGAFIVAMIVFHPIGEPWLWAALLVFYIPALLIIVAAGLYLTRVILRLHR